MVFSSNFFVFFFLPLIFLLTVLAPLKARNSLLLAASLIFYSWGEPSFIWIMLLSIAFNYVTGLAIHRWKAQSLWILSAGIVINLALLGYFKYLSFLVENFNVLGPKVFGEAWQLAVPTVVFPIGISFFTFHAISYLIDIYRGLIQVQRNLFSLALYIAFFPQLVAGPIVRYKTIEAEIKQRSMNWDNTYHGLHRFMIGMLKKLLIANPLGFVADQVFSLNPDAGLGSALAWYGIIAYSLQIYFDFSGYSDMAIGLARIFGFHFAENFEWPYNARSVQDFWRRWHISLSTWFRDYLYIPLGGSRNGTFATYRNLLIVFFVTGLWHGASWNFIVWGLFHGGFLLFEKTPFGAWMRSWPDLLQRAYLLLVVIVGWVFFRAPDLSYALNYLQVMFTPWNALPFDSMAAVVRARTLDVKFVSIMLAGMVFSLPCMPFFRHELRTLIAKSGLPTTSYTLVKSATCLVMLAITGLWLSAQSYNPFIYFRF